MEGIIKALEKDGTEWALKQIEVTFIQTYYRRNFPQWPPWGQWKVAFWKCLK